MPIWEVGEDEPDERPGSACKFCMSDLPDGQVHEDWCPEKEGK